MPLGDGTGPAGMGPMTGRAAGYCAGYSVPGYMNPYGGRFGGRMGWRSWPGPGYGYMPYGPYTYSEDMEKQTLENQVQFLETQITRIRERLEELESQGDEE